MPDYEAALRRLSEKSLNRCPGCNDDYTQWTIPKLVGLPEITEGAISDHGPEAYVYACKTCGYMRFHAVEIGD